MTVNTTFRRRTSSIVFRQYIHRQVMEVCHTILRYSRGPEKRKCLPFGLKSQELFNNFGSAPDCVPWVIVSHLSNITHSTPAGPDVILSASFPGETSGYHLHRVQIEFLGA